MAETKHEFIDDNPYITYTGKPETAYDGEGGGGGGGYTLPIASAETLGGVKIGDGLEIAESGVLSVDAENETQIAVVYFPNSDIGWQILGNFEKCLDAIKNNRPFIAFMAQVGGSGTYSYYIVSDLSLQTIYDSTKPNQIDLMITGGVGLIWTENGVEYYD